MPGCGPSGGSRTAAGDRTDDLDGSTQDVTTLHFTYDGAAYSIDLDPTNVATFDVALAPYLTAARRVGGSPRPTTAA